ncbi:hypothetical protein DFH07DRAFT_954405 [Mycena maculata]|uniref:Transmembrane protein n=1 Tax=Mycena maculata TaxID=230809 RepID=A0AAD7JSB4_9AGAR|nr:hypothetical protein DFH07DRAFT_954405 [Mycena maculata]
MSDVDAPGPSPIGLIYLSPDLAKQVQVSTYVCIGALAVSIVRQSHIPVDPYPRALEYRLLSETKFVLSTLAYFLARVGSLCYVLGLSLLASLPYPLGACHIAYRVVDAFYPVSVASIALLFFFRVRAIYARNTAVTTFFGALWFAVLGTSLTITFGGDAEAIGPTKYCIVTKLDSYVGASAIVITVHDTAVFFAISYRLLTNTYAVKSNKDLIKALFSGVYLPSFSRSLFVDGQVYYMFSVISNIVVTTMVYANVSPLYRGFLNIPNITLTSAMACRVYRNTRLGLTRESGNMTLDMPISDADDANARMPAQPTIPLVFTRSFVTDRDTIQTRTQVIPGEDESKAQLGARVKDHPLRDGRGSGRQIETV